ncbi:MAG: porphobilinogen synthase [Alphaproteobacteria bacterium CG_4_9_14_3_um_filter_47_13]|nr:MAG: porphobilinogen synthase [Alphaproteobacteria bacterium CG_4_9_14_3_um_filter_47_13]
MIPTNNNHSVHFPRTRMRRGRRTAGIRTLLRETTLEPRHLILPVFVEETLEERTPINAMPGVFRETETSVVTRAKEAEKAGLGALMLFGVSHHKDHEGHDSMISGGLLDRMVGNVRAACPDLVIMADLCFCEYTDHGHCGPLTSEGTVDNDATLENIARQAIIAARAGADILAPSGMMDGQVAAIRNGLDKEGFEDRAILAYAAKYASHFYGPFRDAAGCSLKKGDRKTYQMDPANGDEALREVALDIQEGADMVMVKPGLPYLDILWRIKQEFAMPTFAYNVSGEYAMLRFAAQAGVLDYENVMMETLTSFRRAGADGILTYSALDAAKILQNHL